MGKYVPALLQIRYIWKTKEPDTAERLLAGRIYFAQRLMEEAESEFKAVLAAVPENEEVLMELGGIYYRQNRYDELEAHLDSIPDEIIEKLAFLLNLEGHLFHADGDHENAAASYACAFELALEQGLFALNSAYELADCGKESEAVEAYLQAARVFLQNESYEDVREVIAVLERLAPDDLRTRSLSAKYAYATSNFLSALDQLKIVCKKKSEDSSDWYLYGLLLKFSAAKGVNGGGKSIKKSLQPGARLRLTTACISSALPKPCT